MGTIYQVNQVSVSVDDFLYTSSTIGLNDESHAQLLGIKDVVANFLICPSFQNWVSSNLKPRVAETNRHPNPLGHPPSNKLGILEELRISLESVKSICPETYNPPENGGL